MNESDDDERDMDDPPSPDWPTYELGAYASYHDRQFCEASGSIRFHCFRLGQALALARERYPDQGDYRAFLLYHRISPISAAQARREYEEFVRMNYTDVEMFMALAPDVDLSVEWLSEADLVARLREVVAEIEAEKAKNVSGPVDYQHRHRLRERFTFLFNRLIHGGAD